VKADDGGAGAGFIEHMGIMPLSSCPDTIFRPSAVLTKSWMGFSSSRGDAYLVRLDDSLFSPAKHTTMWLNVELERFLCCIWFIYTIYGNILSKRFCANACARIIVTEKIVPASHSTVHGPRSARAVVWQMLFMYQVTVQIPFIPTASPKQPGFKLLNPSSFLYAMFHINIITYLEQFCLSNESLCHKE